MTTPAAFELAQVNISRLKAPLDSPQLKAFVDALDPVNADAEAADGYVWRLQSNSGDATDFRVFDDDWLIINLTVWRDPNALTAFMYQGRHREMLSRRNEWFERVAEVMTALWWVPAGHRPTIAEAEARLLHLRANGPTPHAFTLRKSFPAGSDAAAVSGTVEPVTGEVPEGLGCPA
ncbi:DUF3291 domain-containing protein [Streptomyces sp. NBC_01373]|uniref:DUF3291 domain-containing protein n=1 Tax=unclassified Streptomyces TaxID=2593676 RepID=UPI002251475E|nr:DUF3291 domain-containing protein [Streptomyces sp. NBC_01373]MCX4697935.1 DUF3291 domain-containing protein [Streptomyces sp. NBC_01373]